MIRPKIYCVEYHYLDFLLKSIYIFILAKDLKLNLTLKDLGLEEKRELEIWLNDLNPFLERLDTCFKDLI